jgi:hypothetical protein
MAIARPTARKKRREVVERDGQRLERATELQVEDLWIGPLGGPPHIADVPEEFRCNICLQLKSHPVSCVCIIQFLKFISQRERYPCGHGHCYCCIRIWLEKQWECPECRTMMTAPPFRVYAEEKHIARVFGAEWDTSSIEYTWTGLNFPVVNPSVPDNARG